MTVDMNCVQYLKNRPFICTVLKHCENMGVGGECTTDLMENHSLFNHAILLGHFFH